MTSARPAQKVNAFLEQQMRTGQLRPGVRLPAAHELASRLQVSIGTVKNVYRALAQQGRVQSQVGVGSFWLEEPPEKHSLVIGIALGDGHSLPTQSWVTTPWSGAIFGGILQHRLECAHSISLEACPSLKFIAQTGQYERLDKIDGLIDLNLSFPLLEITDSRGRHIPCVHLNPPTEQSSLNFVSPDYFECSRIIGKLWRTHGHRRVLMVSHTSLEKSTSNRLRFSGLLCGIGEALGSSIEVRLLNAHPDNGTDEATVLNDFFFHGWRPDAVYSGGGGILGPILNALESHGLTSPSPVSLISGSDYGRDVSRSVTTMVHPLEQVGRELLAMLLRRIESGGHDEPGRYLPVPFRIGSTTQPEENRHLSALSKNPPLFF